MTRYVLEISSWARYVAGARHYRGRVKSEHIPRGVRFDGGTWYDKDSNPVPGRVEWDVEAEWTEARYERYRAAQFEGQGPAQFDTEEEVTDTAARRFLGQAPVQWWEPKMPALQPGDQLYLYWLPGHAEDDDGNDMARLLATVPPARKRLDTDRHYRWAVTSPAGAVDFTVTREGFTPSIIIHYPTAANSPLIGCELLPGGTCDAARQACIPGLGLYKRWVAADCDDAVMWAGLEAIHARRFSS